MKELEDSKCLVEEMNMINYTSYFHDGSIIDMSHDGCTIVFSMGSAEISSNENVDNIDLSQNSTIKGKLYL